MRRPIGCAAVGPKAELVVVCDDGMVFFWGAEPLPATATPQEQAMRASHLIAGVPVQHTWLRFHTPIPGSESHAEYDEQHVAPEGT